MHTMEGLDVIYEQMILMVFRRLMVDASPPNAVWHKWFDGTWHDWVSLGGNLASDPAAVFVGP